IYYLSKFFYIALARKNLIFTLFSGYVFLWILFYALKKKIVSEIFIKISSILLFSGIISIFIITYFTSKHSPSQWFILYYSIFGVIIGLAGISLFSADKKNQSENNVIIKFFLLASFFVWVLILFPNPRIRPDHFWAIRRFTAVALPVLTIGMGYFFYFVFFRSLRILKIIGIVFYSVFLSILLRILYPTIGLSECGGLIDGMYSLKQYIKPDSAIVLFDPKIGLYGTPLYFSGILSHCMFIPVGQSNNLMKNFDGLETVLSDFIKKRKNVYFLSFKPLKFPLKTLKTKPLARIKIPIALLEIVINRLPAKTEPIFDIKDNYIYVWKLMNNKPQSKL
ncbi:hypothetical protein J7L67_06575, partial [bacterium]|nr:hypothetical protein [bacterium]